MTPLKSHVPEIHQMHMPKLASCCCKRLQPHQQLYSAAGVFKRIQAMRRCRCLIYRAHELEKAMAPKYAWALARLHDNLPALVAVLTCVWWWRGRGWAKCRKQEQDSACHWQIHVPISVFPQLAPNWLLGSAKMPLLSYKKQVIW